AAPRVGDEVKRGRRRRRFGRPGHNSTRPVTQSRQAGSWTEARGCRKRCEARRDETRRRRDVERVNKPRSKVVQTRHGSRVKTAWAWADHSRANGIANERIRRACRLGNWSPGAGLALSACCALSPGLKLSVSVSVSVTSPTKPVLLADWRLAIGHWLVPRGCTPPAQVIRRLGLLVVVPSTDSLRPSAHDANNSTRPILTMSRLLPEPNQNTASCMAGWLIGCQSKARIGRDMARPVEAVAYSSDGWAYLRTASAHSQPGDCGDDGLATNPNDQYVATTILLPSYFQAK
ncbi:unnamed protein product, partial [Protopolystoma xenopodis]